VIIDRLWPLLPPGWESDDDPNAPVDILFSLLTPKASKQKGVRRYNLLYHNASRLARTLDMDEALRTLESQLELIMAYSAKACLFVHAGVVGWQGQAVVIPGRSFSGKTTLVKALIKTGATYYSDEFAIFDPQGRVHPYPVPLSIRDESGQNPKNHLAEEFGANTGIDPLPVGLVVSTEYHAGATWRPRKITPGRSMLALMDNTVAARKGPEISMPILKQVATNATAVKSKRGEADDVASVLLEMVSKT